MMVTYSNGVLIHRAISVLGHARLQQTPHSAKIVALTVVNDMATVNKSYK